MQLIQNKKYLAMLERMDIDFPHWDKLSGKTLLISGATGMIGSFLVDSVMLHNRTLPPEDWCRLLALGRDYETAQKRFVHWWNKSDFSFIEHDVTVPLDDLSVQPDYWIHAASTSHPLAYSTEPINTILANVLGIRNILDAATKSEYSRVLLLSSVEIYGENRGDTEYFTEGYCGYLDCNTLRAGYPEAKRISEALCQAYITERSADTVIIRLPRCYGPTMRVDDSKAIAQFIKNGVDKKDIVLKSKGEQFYSFAHEADAVLGILWVLLCGETGQAYNLANRQSNIMLKDLAKLVADYAGTRVVFDLPSEVESRGYSTATKALLDGSKLENLGWFARYSIESGIQETIDILWDL